MKTDIKQLLKDLKSKGLEFENSANIKLLKKDKDYYLNDTYLYPCLVEIVIGDSKVFNLKRISKIVQNPQKPVGVESSISTATNSNTQNVIPVVNTNVVSDATAKALIGEFIEKNT